MQEITIKGPCYNYIEPLNHPDILCSKIIATLINGSVEEYYDYKSNNISFDNQGMHIKTHRLIEENNVKFIEAICNVSWYFEHSISLPNLENFNLVGNTLYINNPNEYYKYWKLKYKSQSKKDNISYELQSVKFEFTLSNNGITKIQNVIQSINDYNNSNNNI